VINRGFGGSHMADCALLVDRVVIPYRPKMVLLYAGDNDIAEARTPNRCFRTSKRSWRRFTLRCQRSESLTFNKAKHHPSATAGQHEGNQRQLRVMRKRKSICSSLMCSRPCSVGQRTAKGIVRVRWIAPKCSRLRTLASINPAVFEQVNGCAGFPFSDPSPPS